MFFYFSLVVITILLYNFAERKNIKILYLIAIIPSVLIEGLRNEDIGTDMMGYGSIWYYNMRIEDGLLSALKNVSTPEYAYHTLIFISKKLFNDIHLFLILCASIKMGLVFFVGYKFRKQLNTTLFLAFYFAFFYFTGFSMMRQALALSVCLLSIWYLYNEKYYIFFATVIIAYLFHNSALLMVIVFYLFLTRKMRLSLPINFFGVIILYSSAPFLMQYLIGSSLFKEGIAEHYMNTGVASAKSDILISSCLLLFSIYTIRKHVTPQNYMAFLCSASTLMFLFLSNYIEVAFRISYYFVIPAMLFSLILLKREAKKYRTLGYWAFLSIMAIHFYIGCTHGLGQTLPYRSFILGIY